MAEVRQIPADEYESMKKSYGLSDEQMRSVIGVEPILTKWAEGYGIARPKENEEDKIKERHNQIVAEIKNKLKNNEAKESVAAQTPENLSPSIEEKVEQPAQSFDMPTNDPVATEETTPSFEMPDIETPSFSMPENTDIPSFSMPQEEDKKEKEKEKETEDDSVPSFSIPEFSNPAFEPIAEEETPEFSAQQPNENDDVPTFEMNFDTPSFEETSTVEFAQETSPSVETSSESNDATPTFTPAPESTVIAEETLANEFIEQSENGKNLSLDEMFEMGQKKLLELMQADNELAKTSDFTR